MNEPSAHPSSPGQRPKPNVVACAEPAQQEPCLLVPGETCWRVESAERASVLVDGATYFAALRSAIIAAQRRIVIVGWDVDSRTCLMGEQRPNDGLPVQLLPLLRAVLRRRPELHVYILAWDFSMIYALEREFLPSITFSGVHPRLHFMLDGAHAVGASHHQKLVVIDDCLAFNGGIDLTIRRWDRTSHRVDDALRRDPDGHLYAPMHDIQMAVDGEAARALAELARERWARARRYHSTVPELAALSVELPAPWPRGLQPDFSSVQVGISRTSSGMSTEDPVLREIETLTVRAVLSARHYVYIENQYLTASAVAQALVESLAQPHGPEICVVLPKLESGWLEQSSIGMLRRQVLARLRSHDPHGRLHMYYPQIPGRGDGVQVHCKLIICDERFMKIGSANLSNRSQGLDTECDLTIEARPGDRDAPRISRSIRQVLARLLGEHLELPVEECAAQLAQNSPLALIEARRGRERCLETLPESLPDPALDLRSLGDWAVDPERPMAGETFIEGLLPTDVRHPWLRSTLASLVLLSPVLLMAALWHHWGAAFGSFSQQPLDVLGLWVGYVVACLAFLPVTLLLAAAAVWLTPPAAFVFGVSGALVAAMLAYALGWRFRPLTLRYLRGRRARQLQRSAQVRAFRATVIARLLPVGNFTGSNMLAGALHVPFWRFVFGNFAGLVFGTAGLLLFAQRVTIAFTRPTLQNIGWSLLAGSVMIALCYAVAHLFARPDKPDKPDKSAKN